MTFRHPDRPNVRVQALPDAYRQAAASLVAQVFGNTSEQRTYFKHLWQTWRPRHPQDADDHYRAAFVNGSLVALARVEPRTLHYGRARLRVACIADVCTRPDARNNGYSRAVMQDTLTYAAEQGAHLALLRAIPGYYDRFGFSPVWPRYTLKAPAESAGTLQAPETVREALRDDLPAIAALYERHWGTRVTFSRDPALWYWLYDSRSEKPVIVTERGSTQGYLWADAFDPQRVEVVANTPEALQSLLVYAGDRARRQNRPEIIWSVPPDDVIIPYAQAMLPMTLSAHYAPTGQWMARLIDSTGLIEALQPEILAHMRAMHPQLNADALRLHVTPDGVEIDLSDNPAAHAHLSLSDFIQVLFGSLRPMTLALRHHLPRAAVNLLEMVFPARVASVAPVDWF
jgi:predicted N-acetyltransferase YhbS